mmetsp:Transcript_25546/g.55959  ORF Transcript_25546/g.55959 Transcript_25546/m.55959 type:complete len:169 (-) Transcript_25546:14-520(-)
MQFFQYRQHERNIDHVVTGGEIADHGSDLLGILVPSFGSHAIVLIVVRSQDWGRRRKQCCLQVFGASDVRLFVGRVLLSAEYAVDRTRKRRPHAPIVWRLIAKISWCLLFDYCPYRESFSTSRYETVDLAYRLIDSSTDVRSLIVSLQSINQSSSAAASSEQVTHGSS